MIPPRKGVMAFGLEPLKENGDEFYVLTFHHGLGEMTRLDLDAEDLRQLRESIGQTLKENGEKV